MFELQTKALEKKKKKINTNISHSAHSHFELMSGDTPYHRLSISSLFELRGGGGWHRANRLSSPTQAMGQTY